VKTCHICSCSLIHREAYPFRLPGVTGYLCTRHNLALGEVVSRWAARATTEAVVERAAAEAEEAARLEAESVAAIARQVADDRMALLAAEGLPLATRRELRALGRVRGAA
jgi:hypothetical protein